MGAENDAASLKIIHSCLCSTAACMFPWVRITVVYVYVNNKSHVVMIVTCMGDTHTGSG